MGNQTSFPVSPTRNPTTRKSSKEQRPRPNSNEHPLARTPHPNSNERYLEAVDNLTSDPLSDGNLSVLVCEEDVEENYAVMTEN